MFYLYNCMIQFFHSCEKTPEIKTRKKLKEENTWSVSEIAVHDDFILSLWDGGSSLDITAMSLWENNFVRSMAAYKQKIERRDQGSDILYNVTISVTSLQLTRPSLSSKSCTTSMWCQSDDQPYNS